MGYLTGQVKRHFPISWGSFCLSVCNMTTFAKTKIHIWGCSSFRDHPFPPPEQYFPSLYYKKCVPLYVSVFIHMAISTCLSTYEHICVPLCTGLSIHHTSQLPLSLYHKIPYQTSTLTLSLCSVHSCQALSDCSSTWDIPGMLLRCTDKANMWKQIKAKPMKQES